jgi:hypothetical protein
MKKTEISFFKGGILNHNQPETVTIEWAVDYIRDGVGYNKIRAVRNEADKKKRTELKKKCSYFTFSGTFSERAANKLITHSGFLTIDFDDVSDIESVTMMLKEDQYISLLFRSTSGEGLKALVKIEPSKHLETFLSIEKYFLHKYNIVIDPSGKDVSRACFESIDENIYFNEDSVTYLPEIEESIDFETGELKMVERKHTYQNNFIDDQTYISGIVEQIVSKRIDLTSGYEEWLKIGFSLASLGEAGREFFHSVSEINPDYDSRECDGKFSNCLKHTKWNDCGYFLGMAKRNGCDMRKYQPKESAGQQITTEATPQEEKLSLYSVNWPIDLKMSLQQKKEAEKFIAKYFFFEFKNSIYFSKVKEGEMTFEKKSNYILKPHYLIKDTEGKTSRIVEFINTKNERRIESISTDAFTSMDAFQKYVEKGNYVSSFEKKDWINFKKYFYDITKEANEINTLGLTDEGDFAFANGIFDGKLFHEIDNLGIVSLKKKNYYLPALSDMNKFNKTSYQFEREFVYIKRNVGFTDWAELFCKVYGDNGKIGLIYSCMSLFSDIVFKEDGYFPMLYLFGKPESGKSTMAYSILSLLHRTEGKSVGSNVNTMKEAAFFRRLGQIKNGMVLLEEYNGDIETRTVEALKQIWNRDPYVKSDTTQSNTSNRTVSHPIESSVVITGQHLPVSDVALFTRVILLQYFKHEGFTSEQVEMIAELKSMQNESLTQITLSILKFRDEMKEFYSKAYQKWKRLFSKKYVGANVGRIGNHSACIMATFEVLKDKINFPFELEELETAMNQIAENQNQMMEGSEETGVFWSSMQNLIASNLVIEGEHFIIRDLGSLAVSTTTKQEEVVNFKGLKSVLFIRLEQVEAIYSKELRQQGKKGMDASTLRSYLKNSPAYIGNKRQIKINGMNTSAMAFDYAIIEEKFSLKKNHDHDSSETELTTILTDAERKEMNQTPECPF